MSADPSQLDTVRIPAPSQLVGGRWRILERIGAGGMGLVFLAEHVTVHNRVAIKFLDPERTPDLEVRVQRFLREAKVALEVVHPGAALLLDSGRDDERGYLFLVFEYVDGVDLRKLLQAETRLGFDEAKTIALKIAEPLAFAHARGIVHRDVKPENVRVRRDLAGPHVKVLDFGIARLVGKEGVRLTAEGLLAGTPRYMAPEQVRDGLIDARTDVYALGLVFFEMLTGLPAFDGLNHARVMMRQVNEPLPKLGALLPGADAPQVDALLQKACAKDPAARFQSMAELVAALKPLQAGNWPPISSNSEGKTPVIPVPTVPRSSDQLPVNAVDRSGSGGSAPRDAQQRVTRPDESAAAPVHDRPVMHAPTPHRATGILWVLIAVLSVLALGLLWRLR